MAMLKLGKILLPVDFSELSCIAARDAGMLARRFGSEVLLLHVNTLAPLVGALGHRIAGGDQLIAEHNANRQRQLDAFGGEELAGVTARRFHCSGDPAKVIVGCAQSEKADLIVMPTHGRGQFRRFLLGSVTAKVLHDADCPVWTGTHVRNSEPAHLPEIAHVMCAVDFDRDNAKVLRWAADFASAFGAKLTVAHAIQATPPDLPERYTFQWHDEARWGAQEALRTTLLKTNITADSLVVEGEVSSALRTAAREKGAGLLVIGRSPVSGSTGRLGRRAYGIVCHSPCPVASI
jgi:nucleotide-binding universal stress UspA family protein